MKGKIKLQLTAGELVALAKYLNNTFKNFPMETLRANPADFLILSALHELYSKVKPKAEEIRIFSARKDDQYSVSITRTQALAIVCVGFDDSELTPELITYDATFLKGLIGNIYHEYLL